MATKIAKALITREVTVVTDMTSRVTNRVSKCKVATDAGSFPSTSSSQEAIPEGGGRGGIRGGRVISYLGSQM